MIFNSDEKDTQIGKNKLSKQGMDKTSQPDQFQICAVNYIKDQQSYHVNFNGLWVFEKDDDDSNKSPIKSGDKVRIKNVLLNYYLSISK